MDIGIGGYGPEGREFKSSPACQKPHKRGSENPVIAIVTGFVSSGHNSMQPKLCKKLSHTKELAWAVAKMGAMLQPLISPSLGATPMPAQTTCGRQSLEEIEQLPNEVCKYNL